jgi:hypothetical protein
MAKQVGQSTFAVFAPQIVQMWPILPSEQDFPERPFLARLDYGHATRSQTRARLPTHPRPPLL